MRIGGWCFSGLVLSLVCVACGGSSSSSSGSGGGGAQTAARDQAVSAACNKAQSCNAIGTGTNKTYASMDDCTVKQQGFWQNEWPPKDCDNHIDGAALDTCLTTINTADCGNIADLANIALNKCASGKVCTAG